MRRDRRIPVSLALLVGVLAAACGPSTPEAKVAQQRAQYTVELKNYWQHQPEAAEPADGDMAGEEEAAGEPMADEPMADEPMADAGEGEEAGMEPMPMIADFMFDLTIFLDGRNPLDVLTIDISHADANQTEKAVYHYQIDVSGMINGETRQDAPILTIADYQEGDLFSVSVKPGIPPDLSAYPEFSSPGT